MPEPCIWEFTWPLK